MFHPDRRVREAIQLIFAKFRELWSVRQTFQWFRDHDLELPANPIQGTRLIWKISLSEPNPRHFAQSLLYRCPCLGTASGNDLAGGRPSRETSERATLRRRVPRLHPRSSYRLYYWATYEENQGMMRRNSVNWEGDESMAAIRAGQGLLVGLLRCGHCGRKLHVRYWGGRGTHAR
jgi:hypothetical protein